jgi:hypothetical protein
VNTLRPPTVQQIRRPDDEGRGQRPISAAPSPTPRSSLPLLSVIGMVGIVSLVLLTGIGGRATAPMATPPVAAAIPLPAATAAPARETIIVTATPIPTPDCISAQSQLASVDGLIQQAKWEQAAAQAEEALTIRGLCHTDLRPLTQRAVLAGLQGLYNHQFDPVDAEAHQAAVDTFLRLRERARLSGITFPATLLQVARESYRISQHRLTIAAIELALTEETFNPALDRETTKLYISGLYGLGYWYSQAEKGSALYTEGLSYLAASHQLAAQFKTGQAEAGNLLRQLIGDNKANWPSPYLSPLMRDRR